MCVGSVVEGAVKPDADADAEGEGEGGEDGSKTKDFQAQFLEFSQRRQHQLETGSQPPPPAALGGEGDKGVDDKAGVIAALLQVPVGVSVCRSVSVCQAISFSAISQISARRKF